MNIFGEDSKVVIGSNDFINYATTTNGGKCLEISVSPLSNGSETAIKVNKRLFPNLRAESDISISSRIRNVVSSFEILGRETKETNFNHGITSLQYNLTNLLINLAIPFTGTVGDTVDIYGCNDSRFNLGNLIVTQLQNNNTEVYVELSNGVAIPSVAGSYSGGGTLVLNTVNADNFARYVYSGLSSAKAILQSRTSGSTIKSSGVVNGNHLVPIGSTNHNLIDLTYGVIDRQASNRFIIDCNSNKLTFTDLPLDIIAMETGRAGYSSTVPEGTEYNVVYRTTSSKSRTVPISPIVTISKNGSNVATVLCLNNHGLVAGESVVTITGLNNGDNTLFPTTTATVLSIEHAKSFTIVMGGSGTGTTRGGLVAEVNGGAVLDTLLPSINTVNVNSFGRLTVNLSSVSTAQVGEYVTMYGAADSVSSLPNLNGTYRIHTINGNDVELEPLVAEQVGTNVLIPILSEGYSNTINGSLLVHQTMRIHHMIFETNNHLAIDGQGQRLMSKALPVISMEPLDVQMVESKPVTAKIITTTGNNPTSINTAESILYSINVSNILNQAFFLKIYDDVDLPSVTSDTPYAIIPIPGLSFQTIEFGKSGSLLSNGIAIATTLGHGENSGSVGAGCLINVTYK